MKELSIEEKARRYDEAIERAREFVSKDNVEVAEYIFPELAESEDERIRNRLLDFFNSFRMANGVKVKWEGLDVQKVIAWLEKQEHKPAEWSDEDIEILDNLVREIKLLSHMASMYWKFTDSPETILKFLKSLRPQNRWKPSDEQIKGIECAIKTLKYQLNAGDKRLNSLYNDLKKLKEK